MRNKGANSRDEQKTTEEQRAFDDCWAFYRGTCANGDLRAIDAGALSEQKWRPEQKPRLDDYRSDFALAGRAALKRAELHSRLVLFEFYYLGGASYGLARARLGIGEIAWTQWTEQIRSVVGAELQRRGIWPLRQYFGQ